MTMIRIYPATSAPYDAKVPKNATCEDLDSVCDCNWSNFMQIETKTILYYEPRKEYDEDCCLTLSMYMDDQSEKEKSLQKNTNVPGLKGSVIVILHVTNVESEGTILSYDRLLSSDTLDSFMMKTPIEKMKMDVTVLRRLFEEYVNENKTV